MTKQDILNSYQSNIMNTYTRTPAIFVKGKGMDLTDVDGKKYLDFFPGWGVNNVGHCHPKVMAAVRDQIGKLIFVPNNFLHPHQAKLAKEIIRNSFPGKVFFCNSGAEANEAMIKFSRAYGNARGGRFEIITMQKSFHGRTLAAVTATGQAKYQEGFSPLPSGFKHVPFNDWNALAATVTDKTIAIMLEPIQGEGGIHVADMEYLRKIRALCDEKDILLAFDEVQTGMGRCGEMFAFKHFGVKPDLMMLAKALGGGLPIGALVVREGITDTLKPGMHASTFGGSPLVCKASLGVFEAIKSDKMLANAKKMGAYLKAELLKLKDEFDCIADVRGVGLMIGVELSIEGKQVWDECFKRGLIINCTQGNVLRVMPALNVTKKQADKALYILKQALQTITGQSA